MIARSVLLIALIAGICLLAHAQPALKPHWPQEFSAPFGLTSFSDTLLPIVNQSSTFYYNFDQLSSQRIQYPKRCLPFFPGATENGGCDIYFNANGTYFSQPQSGLDCCSMFPGIGAVPPEFLQGFTYNGTATAPDFYGQEQSTYYWTGPGGFAYWTLIPGGHDIFFNDGNGFGYWGWGLFNVTAQPAELFELPGEAATCAKPCPGFGSKLHMQTLANALEMDINVAYEPMTNEHINAAAVSAAFTDPMIKLAAIHHVQASTANYPTMETY